jgi:hypothetical protein
MKERVRIMRKLIAFLALLGAILTGSTAVAEEYAGRTVVTNFTGDTTITLQVNPGARVDSVRLKYGSAKSYTFTLTTTLGSATFLEATTSVTTTQHYKYAPSNVWLKQGDQIRVQSSIADVATLIITYVR